MSNFMNIRPVGAEFCHEDRRTSRETDMTKLIVDFRSFASVPKNKLIRNCVVLVNNERYMLSCFFREPVT
jgi:hypothetical protein